MTYTRRLTVALRARSATEGFIADVVRETDGLDLPDEELEVELGPPEEYARHLVPDLPQRRKVGAVMAAGLLLAAVWLIVLLVGAALGWDVRSRVGPTVLWPAIVAMLAGIVGQFAVDYYRRAQG